MWAPEPPALASKAGSATHKLSVLSQVTHLLCASVSYLEKMNSLSQEAGFRGDVKMFPLTNLTKPFKQCLTHRTSLVNTRCYD